MRVGIFETGHFEGAYPVIKLFDNGTNEITIFCYQESFRQFQFLFSREMEKYVWIVRAEDESKRRFIQRMYEEIRSRNLQLVYLNTISDNFIFYYWMVRRLKGVRVVLTIHSINNFFWKLPSLTFRTLIRHIGKKRLIKSLTEFNVVALTLVAYLKSKLPLSATIYTVPGAIYEGRNLAVKADSSQEYLKIVVPGVIDERRRDYSVVQKLAGLIANANLPIRINLLGGVNPDFGKKIIEELKNSSPGSIITYYTDPVVDQPEFDRQMDEADLVWLPTIIQTYILDKIYEEYGITQSTGTLFDVIKHAKPFLAPRTLRVDPFLEESCLRYDSADDIIEILRALLESPQVRNSLLEKARLASENYTLDAVRNRNRGLFDTT